jgi:EAL domain-containing protein (putative c-di-GMP-specific phosphodiesterase class I)
MLAQLGCGHVQGYVVARPMPAEEVAPWLDQHQAGLNRALCDMRAR